MNKLLLSGAILAAIANAFASPPLEPLKELKAARSKAAIVKVDDLPAIVRQSLAKAFDQKSLQLANPSDKIGGSVTYTGDPNRNAPYRRLIFAVKTQNYTFVYYEKGDPENSAACLIFDISKSDDARLIWGGVDLQDEVAKTSSQLSRRIEEKKLWDDHPYIW